MCWFVDNYRCPHGDASSDPLSGIKSAYSPTYGTLMVTWPHMIGLAADGPCKPPFRLHPGDNLINVNLEPFLPTTLKRRTGKTTRHLQAGLQSIDDPGCFVQGFLSLLGRTGNLASQGQRHVVSLQRPNLLRWYLDTTAT